MPLSWNEIRSRAIRFSKEWEDETNEDGEAKSFLDGFFDVFGISRKRLATFEKRVGLSPTLVVEKSLAVACCYGHYQNHNIFAPLR